MKSRVLFLVILGWWGHLAFAEVDSIALSKAVQESFKEVPEFAFIQEEARKLGLRVYLFGGTASAFAHYVRWNVERLQNDDGKYQAARFDFDFTNIYRGNQDLDIVVDGPAEKAAELERILLEKYDHFIGERSAWEVRLLKESKGRKAPLLGDKDFQRQHSDSNSTGMLDLMTEPGEIVFRDLRDWDNPSSKFLEDVAAARITFYYSLTHEETKRYKDGENPPVLAAVRYLAKLTQYEVEGTDEDLKLIIKIIAETDFADLSDYGKRKAKEFAEKALLNAPNVEYAWNLLEQTGVRKKIIKLDGNRIDEPKTLSWWMNREPLRSEDLGVEGQTAEDLFAEKGWGELIVSHETESFIAFENITRSARGEANVFVSRNEIDGENAVYGNGFYTKVGLSGAARTDLTIRFKLHPKAIVGKDFVIGARDYIVILNKKAIELIPDKINIDAVDFLKLLTLGEITQKDKGYIVRFSRKFDRMGKDSEEFKAAMEYVKTLTARFNDFPENLQKIFKDHLSNFGEFKDFIDFIVNFQSKYLLEVAREIFDDQYDLHNNLSWLIKIIQIGSEEVLEVIAGELSSNNEWSDYPEILREIVLRGNFELNKKITFHILSFKTWFVKNLDLVNYMLENDIQVVKLIKYSIEYLPWEESRKYIQKAVSISKRLDKKHHIQIIEVLEDLPLWEDLDLVYEFIEGDENQSSNQADEILFLSLLKQLVDYLNGVESKIPSLDFLLKYENDSPSDYFINKAAVILENIKRAEYETWIFFEKYGLRKKLLKFDRENKNNPGSTYWMLNKEPLKDQEFSKKGRTAKDILKDPETVFYHSTNSVFEYNFMVHDLKQPNAFISRINVAGESAVFGEGFYIGKKKSLFATAYTLQFKIHPEARVPDDFELYGDFVVVKNKRALVFAVQRFATAKRNRRESLVSELVKNDFADEALIKLISSHKSWASKPEVIERLLNKGDRLHFEIVTELFTQKHWRQHSYLVERIIDEGRVDYEIIQSLLKDDLWMESPELFVQMALKSDLHPLALEELFSLEQWLNHPKIISYLDGKLVTRENLIQRDKEVDFKAWQEAGLCRSYL